MKYRLAALVSAFIAVIFAAPAFAQVVPPTVSLTASPSSIVAGDFSTLTWNATDAFSCVGVNFSPSGSTSGSTQVTTTENTTYSITCTGPGGQGSASVIITIVAPTPPTATLSANPTTINSGQSSALSWSSTDATSCAGSNFTPTGTTGSASVSPNQTTTYSIVCTGRGGSANASTTVTVNAPTPPTATIAANPASVTTGQSSTLTWSSTNATSCSGTNFSPNGTSGTASVSPTQTTTYTLTCTGAGGLGSASTSVTFVPPAATTATISANPSTINSGQTSTLTWSSTNATVCTGTNFTPAGTAGSLVVSPTLNTTYTISCTGVGGLASASSTISVVAPTTPTATISANPSTINSGQTSTLTWSSTNAASCTGTNFSPTGTAGSLPVSPTQTTNYAVKCTGTGGIANASATVTINQLPPPPPPNNTIGIGSTIITKHFVIVRSSPGGRRIGLQPNDSLGTVVDGPITAGGHTWWKIDYGSGADGWSAQAFIELYTPPFSIGSRVQTTGLVGVRTGPGAWRFAFQRRGSVGTVVGGPTSDNGHVWWKIDYDRNPDGWTAERFLVLYSTSSRLMIPHDIDDDDEAANTTASQTAGAGSISDQLEALKQALLKALSQLPQ